jgi:hypothetical protein
MKRKILFFSLFILLACGFAFMLCFGAGAEAATVSNTASLKAALESAEKGDTITLGDSFTLSETLTVNTAVTINGNGHTLTAAVPTTDNKTFSKAFVINADLTLHNVTVAGNGSCRLLNVPAGASPTLTVSGNTALTAGAELPIYSVGNPKIVINGDTATNGVRLSGNHGM